MEPITIKELLISKYKWSKKSFLWGNSCIISANWSTSEATLAPFSSNIFSRFITNDKNIALINILGAVDKLCFSTDLLYRNNDLSSYSKFELLNMSKNRKKELSSMQNILELESEIEGCFINNMLEHYTLSIDFKRNYSNDDLKDYPYDEMLKLVSYNTSLKTSEPPHICLEDSKSRKWYFNLQSLAHADYIKIS